jgi:hypothetical protein
MVAANAVIVNRFSVKVMPNHGANTIVDTLAASNSVVSQVPSSWPIDSAPWMSFIDNAVTCSLRMADNDASNMPIRPTARRKDNVACADAVGAVAFDVGFVVVSLEPTDVAVDMMVGACGALIDV